MKNLNKIVCQYRQQLAWEPNPIKSPVKGYQVEDDESLLTSKEQDVHGFSLSPMYSKKQLRRINRLNRRNHTDVYSDRNTIQRTTRQSDNNYMIAIRELKRRFYYNGNRCR